MNTLRCCFAACATALAFPFAIRGEPLPLPPATLPAPVVLPSMVVTPGGQRLLLDYTDAKLTFDPKTRSLRSNKPGWWFINYPADRLSGLDPVRFPALVSHLSNHTGEVKNWYWRDATSAVRSIQEPLTPSGPVPLRVSDHADYIVNPALPQADDAGPGTADQPFKTLAAAVQHAQAGMTVHVYPGLYREKIELTSHGTQDAPIRFEGIRGPHGEWPVITGNEPFPAGSWSRVTNLPGVWRAPLFTNMFGSVSANLDGRNVTLIERGRPHDLRPGDYAFNRGADEALLPAVDPAAPAPRAGQRVGERAWRRLETDDEGMLDLEKTLGPDARGGIIWLVTHVWLDPESRPAGEVWDPNAPEPITGRVSFGGPFRAFRQTGSGPGSQSHPYTLYLNGNYIEPVTYRLGPQPENAVQASASRNYGVSDSWGSLPYREGWNTLLVQLDTTASARTPLQFRLGLPTKRTGRSSAEAPAAPKQAPSSGKQAAFATEFLALEPIPAQARPSVFVRLPGDRDPNTTSVDLAAFSSPLVRLEGRHTSFRGFEVRHGASYQQRALVEVSGAGALLEGCWIHDGEVRGITVTATEKGDAPIGIRGNHIAFTGHLGIGGIGDTERATAETLSAPTPVSAVIEHNLIEDTNWASYSALWESGGMKLLRLDGYQVRFNYIRRNGLGLWLDWENYGNRIESNLFEDSVAFAIGIEASAGPNLAANNVVLGVTPGPVWFRAGLLTWDGTRSQFIHNLVDTRGLTGSRWGGSNTAHAYSHGNNTANRRTKWDPYPSREMTFLNNVSLGARNAIVTKPVDTLDAGNVTDQGRGAKIVSGLKSLPNGTPGDYAAQLAAVAPAGVANPQADAVTFDYFGLLRLPGAPDKAGPFRSGNPPASANVFEAEFKDGTRLRRVQP